MAVMLRRAIHGRCSKWEPKGDRIDADCVVLARCEGSVLCGACPSRQRDFLGTSLEHMRPTGYIIGHKRPIWRPRATVTTLSDVAEMLRSARREAGLSQDELAQRAGVARTTVARMENLAKGDMSVSALVRLLEAAGYDLKLVKSGHARTVEDILAEQRRGDPA